MLFFFFKQKTAYEMRINDWSSDVCSSDLLGHVWLHVLLALEGVVELAPGGKRVGRLRFEDRHHQPRLRLRDRDEQRAGGDVARPRLPAAFQRQALVTIARLCMESGFVRAARTALRSGTGRVTLADIAPVHPTNQARA